MLRATFSGFLSNWNEVLKQRWDPAIGSRRLKFETNRQTDKETNKQIYFYLFIYFVLNNVVWIFEATKTAWHPSSAFNWLDAVRSPTASAIGVVEQPLSQCSYREVDKAFVMPPAAFCFAARGSNLYLLKYAYLGRNKGTHPPTSHATSF